MCVGRRWEEAWELLSGEERGGRRWGDGGRLMISKEYLVVKEWHTAVPLPEMSSTQCSTISSQPSM